MRNNFIFLLVLSLILGSFSSIAFGEANLDGKLEEVITKVKKTFNISNDYDNFTSRINSYDNKTFFYLNWSDSTGKLKNISVNADIDGNIIYFDQYDSVYKEPESKLAKYTKDEAIKIAKEFIIKVSPDLLDKITLSQEENAMYIWDTMYYFNFIRTVNGIPFSENSISINVNKYTGEVNNYSVNWDRDLVFPSPEKVISFEEGKKAYKDEIGLKLIYKNSYSPIKILGTDKETNYFLAYSTLDGNRKAIDALTGKVIDLNYYGPYFGRGEAAMEKTMDSSVITPEERVEIDKLSGIKSIEEIEKLARNILEIDETYKLSNKNLYSYWKNPGQYLWNLYFIKKVDENNTLTADISLDGKTGEVISFNRYKPIDQNAKPVIKKEEALKLAQEYINRIYSDKKDKVELLNYEYLKDDAVSYYFNFVRKIDDIYVESDRINVGVDAVNKIVTSFSLDWFKGEFPPKGQVIPVDKAYEVLWDKIGYDLIYTRVYDFSKPENENVEIKLVYVVNPTKPLIISSSTGELLDYSGNPYKEQKITEYTDIDNSYAKDKIKTLAEYGISFDTSEFKPKEKITQKDFLYLLWKSIYPYRTYDTVDEVMYKDLANMNIVRENEKNPERFVTKEEGVKFIIRAMRYDKIAEIENIFKELWKDQKDISKGLEGHMAIAYGLKILVGDGSNNIRPKYELKREDAGSLIYNYMFMK